MNINPPTNINIGTASFVYEEFVQGPDGTLTSLTNKADIQVVAKRETTAIIPDGIQLTYPLQFKVEDLVRDPEDEEVDKNQKKKKSKNKVPPTPRHTTKSPNKFFIYRKAWVEQFKVEGYQYSMTDISGFIAKRWQGETEEIKAVFIDLAERAKALHKEKYSGIRKTRNIKKPKPKKPKNDNNRVNKTYNNKTNNQCHYSSNITNNNNTNNINSNSVNGCLINNNNIDTCFISNSDNLLESDNHSLIINTFPYYTPDITAQYHQQSFLNYNMSYNDTSALSSPELSLGNVSPGSPLLSSPLLPSPPNETRPYLELCPSGHDGSLMLLVE